MLESQVGTYTMVRRDQLNPLAASCLRNAMKCFSLAVNAKTAAGTHLADAIVVRDLLMGWQPHKNRPPEFRGMDWQLLLPPHGV